MNNPSRHGRDQPPQNKGKKSSPAIQARAITVWGTVQGVGFRPFVFGLAQKHGLLGKVGNSESGVIILAQGVRENLDAFAHDLEEKAPPLASIERIVSQQAPVSEISDFTISPSQKNNAAQTLVPPDTATCADCLAEIRDPADRRHGYAFTNCTNCGPRLTIVHSLPYDRPATSMSGFAMCPDCQKEYDDPSNRRFHAQPNACPVCGPRLSLLDKSGKPIAGIGLGAEPLENAVQLIKEGRILAIKGLGGFHLCCDAADPQAVDTLRQRKKRKGKPFAVMVANLDAARNLALVNDKEKELLQGIQRPVLLLEKRDPGPLAPGVAPGLDRIGVMLPYTPLHHLLLDNDFEALVMTSANLSEEPICTDNDEAVARLSGIADYYLVHDRPIVRACDDSVAKVMAGAARPFRRSRGYAPSPVLLKNRVVPVLACGALLKNTVCLARGQQAILSQHIGDLENLESFAFFQGTIQLLEELLETKPRIAACDLHPDYLSTQYARGLGIPVYPVQHHHAHVASCMAENQAEGPVIGIAADGAGLGPDQTVWGGEILVADYDGFQRAAHLETVGLPGGDKAAREPWRMALSHLHNAYGKDLPLLPFLDQIPEANQKVVLQMIQKKTNCPPTSSMGRLFDAVAAILGLCLYSDYEGHAAMVLEAMAQDGESGYYSVEIQPGPRPLQIPASSLIRAVVKDVQSSASPGQISARFHNTLARLLVQASALVREDTGINTVALSGGVFQNALLLSQTIQGLEALEFEVLTHTRVPAGDGGISLGQAAAASAMAKKGNP